MSENAGEIPDEMVRRQDSPALDPDSGPIIAHGSDLADGGVDAAGHERDHSPYTQEPDDLPEVGIGGARGGQPHHPGYELDPVLPPGARPAPHRSSEVDEAEPGDDSGEADQKA